MYFRHVLNYYMNNYEKLVLHYQAILPPILLTKMLYYMPKSKKQIS